MADLLTDLAPVEPTHCDWCLTFSGLTKKGRACCELRALAAMPKERRQAFYQGVWKDQGFDVATKLKQDVAAEYQRKVAHDAAKRTQYMAAAKAALVRPKI